MDSRSIANPAAPRVPPGSELRQVLAVLRRRRALIAVVLVAAVVAAAYVYRYGTPEVYVATATINVVPQAPASGSNQGGNLQGLVQNVSALTSTLQTYLWQVTGPAVLQAAANDLKAHGVPLTTDDLRKDVTAELTPGTNLIQIQAATASPGRSAAVANAVASAYLQAIQQQDRAKLSQAVDVLQQQAEEVSAKLAQATAALSQAEARAGVSPDTQARISADQQQIAAITAQLEQARVTLSSDQAGLQSVQAQLAQTPPTTTAAVTAGATASQPTPNPLYTSLQSQLQAEQLTVVREQATVDQLKTTIQNFQYDTTQLSQTGGTQELVSLNAQLVQAEVALSAAQAAVSSLKEQLAQVPPQLTPPPAGPLTVPNPTYQALQAKVSTLETAVAQDQATVAELTHALAAVQADAATLPHPSAAVEANIQTLQTQVDQLTQTYKTLSAGLTQSQVTDLVLQGNAVVTLAAAAEPPALPVKKSSKKLVALALAGGLAVAVGLVLLLEQLDAIVRTPEDIERLTALPTLGVIPHMGR